MKFDGPAVFAICLVVWVTAMAVGFFMCAMLCVGARRPSREDRDDELRG